MGEKLYIIYTLQLYNCEEFYFSSFSYLHKNFKICVEKYVFRPLIFFNIQYLLFIYKERRNSFTTKVIT